MPAPEVIEISWTAIPPGQVGPRPRRIAVNGTFQFHTTDPGDLVIEFKDSTPLENGLMAVPAGSTVTAKKTGTFKFRCIRKRPNLPDLVLDPDDPNLPDGGGSMEVLPDGN